jgi:hypothetical protein
MKGGPETKMGVVNTGGWVTQVTMRRDKNVVICWPCKTSNKTRGPKVKRRLTYDGDETYICQRCVCVIGIASRLARKCPLNNDSYESESDTDPQEDKDSYPRLRYVE